MNFLTPYEQLQIEQIERWKAESPGVISGILEKLTQPLSRLIGKALKEEDLENWIRSAYDMSEVMAEEREFLERAGVGEIRDMRRKDLAQCDQLADHYILKAGKSALCRTLTSAGGGLLNVPLMMSYSLKTVHNVGFCYGFGMRDHRERDFAFGVLQVACANTLKAKQDAFVVLGEVEQMIVQEVCQNVAKEAVIDALAEHGRLASLPLIGLAAGVVHDAALAQHTGRVAKYCFQARWLRRQRKIDKIDAEPALARSKVVRIAEDVSTALYWTFFSVGLVACYPPLLLCSLLPAPKAVRTGLADGRDAAREDVCRLRRSTSRKGEPVDPPVREGVLRFARATA
jgi:hypothetical protein